jgi:hypothetical protein
VGDLPFLLIRSAPRRRATVAITALRNGPMERQRHAGICRAEPCEAFAPPGSAT